MGEARFALAVLAATIEGMPLVYNGQETSLDRRLKFFDKDSINWDKMDLVDFYSRLLHLHQSNEALHVGLEQTEPRFLSTKDQKEVLVFERKAGENRVLVLLNLSNSTQKVKVTDVMQGIFKNLFEGEKVVLKTNQSIMLKPWGYIVYEQ